MQMSDEYKDLVEQIQKQINYRRGYMCCGTCKHIEYTGGQNNTNNSPFCYLSEETLNVRFLISSPKENICDKYNYGNCG